MNIYIFCLLYFCLYFCYIFAYNTACANMTDRREQGPGGSSLFSPLAHAWCAPQSIGTFPEISTRAVC